MLNALSDIEWIESSTTPQTVSDKNDELIMLQKSLKLSPSIGSGATAKVIKQSMINRRSRQFTS